MAESGEILGPLETPEWAPYVPRIYKRKFTIDRRRVVESWIARDDPVVELAVMLGASIQADVGLNVVGNKHGIEQGWFNWPYNFDPVWLESCDGFEEEGSDDH